MSETTTGKTSIVIGGDAGQGVESSGAGMSLAFARGGLHVFGLQDYRSQIRGGHNFYHISLSDRPLYSHAGPVHLLLALTAETVPLHLGTMAEGAGVVYDEKLSVDLAALRSRNLLPFAMPLGRIAEEHGSRIMINTAALGAAAGVTGWPLEFMESVIRDNFESKGAQAVSSNIQVARAAFSLARERYAASFAHKLAPQPGKSRLLINGNEAFCLGAVAGGCRFVSAYPMTPATTIIEWMSRAPRHLGIVTKHTEDEIAAVCMAIGASYVGARAMCATSGGGFSLMVEALGLAGMTEVPLVVVEAQRGGPSTGLPTRTEQSDLLFVVNASQGEFPRIVLAPGSVEECFETGWRAFNLAEGYQCPVIVLTDQFLASSLRTVEPKALDFSSAVIDRGATLSSAELDEMAESYRRFTFTRSGVSPRALPGHPNAVHVSSSDEHDEQGHISEDTENRRSMMEKRMRKLGAMSTSMRPPRVYGPEEAEVTLVCWGSTYGPAREAVDTLNAKGPRANLIHFVDIWPFPEDVSRLLKASHKLVAVEQNYTGQLAKLVRMSTGIRIERTVNKYDGRAFSPQEIVAALD